MRICAGLVALAGAMAWAYDYDEADPKQGAGPQAPWRAYARWDTVDEDYTRDIHRFTTEPRYLTPMVSFVPEHPTVPSPKDVLGYIAGAEGKLTHPNDTKRYFQALAGASPRVELLTMGMTEEGREMLLVVVSSEENLARVADYKRNMRRLADPRQVTEAQALDIIARTKPIMHVTAGLHSPETGPPEMVMELAYRLATSDHPDIVEMRDNVVLLITPVTDVDGRAQVVEWYYRHLQNYDSRFHMPPTSPPYWGKYSFHDNNRDGIQLTQQLTINYLDTFNEWLPVYSLDLHESVPLLYVAGGTGPYNPTLDPIVIREWQLLAHWELAELQKHNLPGVWTWGFYDGWNPGYLLWVTNNRNSMGRFYETFGNSSPKTMERDLSDATYAGKPVTSAQWYRADPPDEKVVWSLRNNTNYMQAGVLASLTFTARNGALLLHNFWRKGRNSIDRGLNETPHAFVIPREQRDAFGLAKLLGLIDKHGIEIHRATADFELKDGKFKAGDYIVRLDQPYGNHARNLLEEKEFPPDAEHRPYDDVAWTLGLFYKLDTLPVDDKAVLESVAMERVSAPFAFPGALGGEEAWGYAVPDVSSTALITARYRLKHELVLAAEQPFEAAGRAFPAGTWLIPNRRGLQRRDLEAVARDCMVGLVALPSKPEVPTHELDLPRIALYHTWTNTQNDGWVRYTLERAGVPFDYINDDHLKAGGLRAKYDVILMAHLGGTGKTFVHGRDTKFGPMAYTPTKDFPSHGAIDSSRDITGGMGFRGLAHLEDFLDRGGVLLLMGGAGRLATDMGLLRNVDAAQGAGVDTPGSFIQAQVERPEHPIAFGYEKVNHVFRVNGPLYSVPEQYDHWIVLKYGTAPLRKEEKKETAENPEEKVEKPANSEETEAKPEAKKAETPKPRRNANKFLLGGFAGGKSTLEKSAAILDVPRHEGGRVVLYSFNPLHRHLNHGDHNYVYNALLHWNDFPRPKPKDHPGLELD